MYAQPAARRLPDARRIALLILVLFVAATWIEEIVDAGLLDDRLDADGIRARELDGLPPIVWAPFLHAGFEHLIANTVAFIPLSLFAIVREAWQYRLVLPIGALTSGFAAWLLSPANTIVIGASGVVFALLGYLLLRGWFTRQPAAIVVSIAVAALYYGTLAGLLPTDLPISWQGHLGGFAGGVAAARALPSRS
jgi:membrane associated rhomboid family serine protease